MAMLIRLLTLIFTGIAMTAAAAPDATTNTTTDLSNTVILQVPAGKVVIALRPDLAPHHVERMKILAKEHFYDNIVFHRVIRDFMVQTGDPTGTGMGGSSLPNLKAEFNAAPHVRGAVSMARAASPDSANSQFFIVLKDNRYLDGQYTVFGYVTEGMEHIDAIKQGDPAQNGMVKNPDHIISLRLADDTAASS